MKCIIAHTSAGSVDEIPICLVAGDAWCMMGMQPGVCTRGLTIVCVFTVDTLFEFLKHGAREVYASTCKCTCLRHEFCKMENLWQEKQLILAVLSTHLRMGSNVDDIVSASGVRPRICTICGTRQFATSALLGLQSNLCASSDDQGRNANATQLNHTTTTD